MRRGISLLLRLAPMLSVLIVPACFSLPKADVIRLVDDFAADAGLQPTWSAFEKWTCSSYVERGQASDGGRDAGLGGGGDAGQGGLDGGADAGPAVSCQLTSGPGDPSEDTALKLGVTGALVAHFGVTAPSEVEVATRTKSAMSDGATDALPPAIPVDLTAFTELRFNATLVSETASLPVGTGLRVELRCAYALMNGQRVINDLLLYKNAGVMQGVSDFQPIHLSFSEFEVASQRQTCLANVESIGFIVVPGSAQPGTKIAGTLQLDNIRFDNAPPQ